MRGIVYLIPTNQYFVISDQHRLEDGRYLFTAPTGGKVVVPSDNVLVVMQWSDSRIDGFRLQLSNLEKREGWSEL